MRYQVQFKASVKKDLKKIDKRFLDKIFDGIDKLQNNLEGDVKKLTNFIPEYRLRIGDYRVLFEIEDNQILIYKIVHRKEAY